MSSIISFMVGFAGIIIVALFLSGCAQGNILPITDGADQCFTWWPSYVEECWA